MISSSTRIAAGEELEWFVSRARAPRLRTMREFAEQEIIIPDGPFAGRRFNCDRQPYTRLWFDAVDSGEWNRFVVTGPTQTGKTLMGFVCPLLYHLFEIGETVICGLPNLDMAADKWRLDILPVIERSRFRDLLPTRGGGSRGASVQSVRFGNGATLKFMSGGGADKSRAGFTSRVLVVTETDGMDAPGTTSREADKITQLEARTRAYGARKRVYLECTVSIEEGRTWQEYQAGTESRIVIPCPHCGDYVSPEREHLAGWQDAESAIVARDSSWFFCPACDEAWSEEDRRQANLGGRLIHRGQSIDRDGLIEGPEPRTDTMGFRWSAVNNLFATAGDIGADEWRASRSADEENAEREMRQFVWCLPSQPPQWDTTPLTAQGLMGRMANWPQRLVPRGTEFLTVGLDLGKWLAHWIAVAWLPEGRSHIVDYGRLEIATDQLGVEKGIMLALREFRDLVTGGEKQQGAWMDEDGDRRIPDQVWIDAGYQEDVVYAFCREAGERFRPTLGRGASQQRRQWYNRPKSTGSIVRYIGEGYHIVRMKTAGVHVVEINADHWKTFLHQRLNVPMDSPGAMTLFRTLPREHTAITKHLTAERQIEEFVTGKGLLTRWERVRRNNHWLDALYLASAAGHFCGWRLVAEQGARAEGRGARVQGREARGQGPGAREEGRFRRPDGQAYLITER